MELTTKAQRFGKIPPREYRFLFDEMIKSDNYQSLFNKHFQSHIHPMLMNYILRFKTQSWFESTKDDLYAELALTIVENIERLRNKNLDRDFNSFLYIGHILHFRTLNYIERHINKEVKNIPLNTLYNI